MNDDIKYLSKDGYITNGKLLNTYIYVRCREKLENYFPKVVTCACFLNSSLKVIRATAVQSKSRNYDGKLL